MSDEDLCSVLGLAIRSRREHLQLSQEQLGFRAQLHRTYIADIERGARNPSLRSIARLAVALEWSLADLFATLPLSVAPTTFPLTPGTPAIVPASGQVEILLVEDEPNDAELAIYALRKSNLSNRVHLVSDGAEALKYLFERGEGPTGQKRDIPHVVLLDLHLPKIDGFEVLRRMKADERTRGIPVVVLTSSQRDTDVLQSRNLGADAYIVKPVDFPQFSLAVPRLGFHWLLLNKQPIVPRIGS